MSLKEYFKNNWWIGPLSIAIGILVVLLTFIIHFNSIPQRDPILYINPIRTQLINSKQISELPIKVSKINGTPILDDINSVTYNFKVIWDKRIAKESILKEIRVKIEDPNVEILKSQVINNSKAAPGFKIEKVSVDTISIKFNDKGKNNQGAFQICYVGNPEAPINASGLIEGVNKLEITTDLSNNSDAKIVLILAGIGSIVLAIVSFVLGRIS